MSAGHVPPQQTPREASPRVRRHALALAAAAALGLLAAPAAWAVSKTVECANTTWTNAVCWNPDGVPVAGDYVHVLPVGTSATTLVVSTGITANATALDVNSGSGTLAQVNMTGGTLTLSDNYIVGMSGSGTALQSGGTLTSGNLYLGYYSGSTGNFSFSGAASAMNLGNLFVGYAGNGSFTMASGSATLTYGLYLGYQDTATSASFRQNAGTITSSNGSIGLYGVGSFEQAGGTHTVSGQLNLGLYAGGRGSYTISGGTFSSSNLYVGQYGSGSVVQDNGNVTTGTLVLGLHAGSSGSYTLNAGTLTVTRINPGAGGSSFRWNGGTLYYDSTLYIANGGVLGDYLSMAGGKILNTAGLINDGSGTVSLTGGWVVAPVLTNNGSMRVETGVVQVDTRFNNFGTLSMGGGTVDGAGAFVNDGTLSGSGTVQMEGSFTNNGLLRAEGGVLYLQGTAGVSNKGSVDLPAGARLNVNNAWTNAGQVQMSGGTLAGSTLTNTATGLLAGRGLVEVAVVNQGQITVSGGSLVLGSTLNNSGIVHLAGAGTQLAGTGLFTNTGTVQGAGNVAMRVANSGTLEAIGGTLSFSAASNTNTTGGTLAVGEGAKLLMTQGLGNNAGLIQLDGGTYDNGGAPMTNSGRIVGHGNLRAGTLTNGGQISFSFGASSIAAPITNQVGRALIVSNGASATFASNVANAGELRVSAGGAANFFGLVSGAGAINGTGQIRFEGGYAPGGSPTLVTVYPAVTMGASSPVQMELGGTTPGACDDCHDKVIFNGPVTLEGGPLQVLWWNGYAGRQGDAFDLFDWNGGLTGSFGSLELPALAAGLQWQTSDLYSAGVLSVVAVSEPARWVLMLMGAGALLAWRRPRRRG